MNDIEFHPVTAEHWSELAAFFEENGNPNYCWCMRWRLKSTDFRNGDSSERRSALEERIKENTPVGVLAYRDGRAVGWCSVAPRETYTGLERSRILKRIDDRPVWSVVCFFIDPDCRQQGLARGLLEAAVDYAASQGASTVEGYPVEPDKSYRFMGSVSIFDSAGFYEAGVANNGRKIVRFEIGNNRGNFAGP